MKRLLLMLLMLLTVAGCADDPGVEAPQTGTKLIKPESVVLQERFMLPQGFQRTAVPDNSFGAYLRKLPLKKHGTEVSYYNGEKKSMAVYEAVVDLDIGTRDLQQCADAVIRLRAEYLFRERKYEQIHFNFTSGFRADYLKWRAGYRVKVQGSSVSWQKTAGNSGEYQDFRQYLDTVFAYAGTLSLAKELVPVRVEEMQVGDVFIQGGSPGHCVIVVDMAENTSTGGKLFMLAQSYMPAQDIQILKNQNELSHSPWYSLNFGETLITPEWRFSKHDLKRFP